MSVWELLASDEEQWYASRISNYSLLQSGKILTSLLGFNPIAKPRQH